MRFILTFFIALLILTACTPKAPENNSASTSIYPSFPLGVSAEIGFKQSGAQGSRYQAQGNNPLWSVSVVPGVAKVSMRGSGSKNIDTEFSVTEDDKGGMITIRGVKGDLFLNLIKSECVDSVTDIKYPYKASLFIGESSLEGCGQKISSHQ